MLLYIITMYYYYCIPLSNAAARSSGVKYNSNSNSNSVYMCVYVYMYLCIYVSTYIRTISNAAYSAVPYTCTISNGLCIYASMYLYVYISTYLCIYVPFLYIYVSMYLHTYVPFVMQQRGLLAAPAARRAAAPVAPRTSINN